MANIKFDLAKTLYASKDSFSIAELRRIWKDLRDTYSLDNLESISGSTKLYENLTLGEFAIIQLHFRPQRATSTNTTKTTTMKIPTEEWWALVSKQFEYKQKISSIPTGSAESSDSSNVDEQKDNEEFPFHLFETEANTETDEDEREEEEKEEETIAREKTKEEIKPKNKKKKQKLTTEEKRLKRRHTRRLREGLNSSTEFPSLSMAQIRLYLHMIRSLEEFPMDQIVGVCTNGKPLILQNFAIRYLFADQVKRYNIKMNRKTIKSQQ